MEFENLDSITPLVESQNCLIVNQEQEIERLKIALEQVQLQIQRNQDSYQKENEELLSNYTVLQNEYQNHMNLAKLEQINFYEKEANIEKVIELHKK